MNGEMRVIKIWKLKYIKMIKIKLSLNHAFYLHKFYYTIYVLSNTRDLRSDFVIFSSLHIIGNVYVNFLKFSVISNMKIKIFSHRVIIF